MTGRRIVEQDRRRSLAAERTVIANVGPKPAGADLDLRQHRHGRVVHMKAFGREHMAADFGQDRIEGRGAGADPVGEGRNVEVDPLAGEGVGLTVQRQMVAKLADQDHGEQARASEAARDGVRRRRRLGDGLAVPAGEFLAHALDDLPAPRLAFERLRHDLAELAQARPAAPAAGARRDFHDALDRQIVRQLAGTAGSALLRRSGRRRHLGAGLFLRLRLLQIFDHELELLDEQLAALRRLSETLVARLGELELQPLDLESARFGFGLRGGDRLALRQDHRVRARQIGWKIVGRRFGGACHVADLSRFGRKNRPQTKGVSQSAAAFPVLSCGRRTPGLARRPPVDAGQKIAELRSGNRHHAVRDRGPQEAASLQAFRKKTRALSVMPNDLDQVASSPPKDPQIAGMRIALERFLHQERKRTEPLAHIRMARRQPNPRAARKGDHRRGFRAVRAPITRVSVAASGAPSTVTRTCAPIEITIDAGAGAGGATGSTVGAPISAASPISPATCKGTNVGAVIAFASWRRHR
jgi:hypothetical protein